MDVFCHDLKTNQFQELINITSYIKEDIATCGIKEGIIIVYCPHTTAGITINENADPDVCTDLIYGYEKTFPTIDNKYLHYEGNSHAHMKSSAIGASQTLILHQGELISGIWQGIYFCEFDGPRNRKFYVKIIEG